jgi:hypothetical protein
MKKLEEIRLPPPPAREDPQPVPIRPDDADCHASDDLPPLPISPPPMPWPRVFPSL